nr:melanocortin receptor 5 isoform X3 [Anas platyrhynchos]|eukprot:XP_012953662.1 melanocortin receptor 5 isoform X3 [Anas platyrhynchos]
MSGEEGTKLLLSGGKVAGDEEEEQLKEQLWVFCLLENAFTTLLGKSLRENRTCLLPEMNTSSQLYVSELNLSAFGSNFTVPTVKSKSSPCEQVVIAAEVFLTLGIVSNGFHGDGGDGAY